MTIGELREETAPIAETLEGLADFAEQDDFAPWVVMALREAARCATLSEDALAQFRIELLEEVAQ